MNHTQESLNLTTEISDKIGNKTFHHHYHILYDISETFTKDKTVNYLEIGCYAGGSACLLLQRPNTNVISIDLGSPISKNVVEENVTKLNKHKNNYTYIEGNSHLISTYDRVSNIVDNIDILFIDGDHTYDGARTDFEMYSKLVNDGGYIIFDDYLDTVHSPEVFRAVNDIVKNLDTNEYEIIGSVTYDFLKDTNVPNLTSSNEFILKKIKSNNPKI
jgi:predicted O-methyltransferase YrrM